MLFDADTHVLASTHCAQEMDTAAGGPGSVWAFLLAVAMKANHLLSSPKSVKLQSCTPQNSHHLQQHIAAMENNFSTQVGGICAGPIWLVDWTPLVAATGAVCFCGKLFLPLIYNS